MASNSNIIVTKTVNRTTFEVDKGSYSRTIKAIKDVKKQWEGATAPISNPKNNPARQYDKSAREIQMVNKRLEDTRRKEAERTTQHAIAMAKKESRAKEQIARQSAARIKQTMTQMTGANPEASKMRKFYQQQEREAKRAQRRAQKAATTGPMNVKRIFSVPLPSRGAGTGMVGNPSNVYSPEKVARQNAAMSQQVRVQSSAKDKAAKEAARQARAAAAQQGRVADTISQQRIRLSSKYGNTYGSQLGTGADGRGIAALNAAFQKGNLSAGQYRQSIQALERQFRSAQGGATTFGSALEKVRNSLVGVGAAYGVFNSGASILKQGQFFQGLDATMLMVSDSSEEAGKRIQFVKDQSMRLGLSLKEASQGYVQMSIAADGILSKGQTDELFKGFSEYSTALQVDPVKYQRGITAIQQMMGKGQIMAEELKGQLAEGIPGSLQVFLKATREAFNDSTIDIAKMMKMMEDGELKSAKIMPFVAKYFAEAANKGGALEKALQGNRVAMQRMQQTWVNFQNAIFEGGFGDTMTKIFNDITAVMNNNMGAAKTLGGLLSSLIEGAWDTATTLYNTFVFIDRYISFYLKQWGYKGDLLKDIFNWGAYALGMGIFIKSLTSVFGILSAIAGLKGPITAIRAAVGGAMLGGGAITTGGIGAGAGAAGTVGAGAAATGLKGLSNVAKVGIFGELMAAMSVFHSQFIQSGGSKMAEAGVTQEQLNKMGMPRPVGLDDVFNEWFGSKTPTSSVPSAWTGASNPAGNPMMTPPSWIGQPLNVNVKVKVDEGQMKGVVQATVEENAQRQYNLLTHGSQG